MDVTHGLYRSKSAFTGRAGKGDTSPARPVAGAVCAVLSPKMFWPFPEGVAGAVPTNAGYANE